jgi:hypothetical protein
LFVIVPGLVLLGASVVPAAPNGVGFAIAGSIVTIVGLLLAYQEATDHWESWSYAWALVGPGGAGVGMLGYGLLYRQADLVGVGVRLVGISLAIFVVGFLFFESIFDNGRVPTDLGTWWPVGVIGLGVLLLIGAVLDPSRRRDGS